MRKHETFFIQHFYSYRGKHLIDYSLAFLGIVIFSPIFLVITVLVKISSPGPIFHKGIRTSKDGIPFRMFKFRTMVEYAEKIGGPSTALNDPRLTKIGKFLRTYKLDELPQLINILKGEMSFVGPRPQVKEYTQFYNKEEKIILTVRPGMTDYATIRYIYLDKVLGNKDVDKLYREKIEPEKNKLRIKYAKNYSFLIDIKIILETIQAITKVIILKEWNIEN